MLKKIYFCDVRSVKWLCVLLCATLLTACASNGRLSPDLTRISIPNEFQLANHGYFSPARVHLVDRVDDNYLLRGNLPIRDGQFVDDMLMATINTRLTEAGISVRPTQQLIVVTLINEITEQADLKIEKDWFAQHPQQGRLIHKPVYGNLIDPSDINLTLRKEAAKRLDELDTLPAYVRDIRKLLTTGYAMPTVVYVHCEAGVDRTGELMGAYNMHFRKLSYQAAMDINTEIAERGISAFSKFGMQWYGLYLQEALGMGSIGIIN